MVGNRADFTLSSCRSTASTLLWPALVTEPGLTPEAARARDDRAELAAAD